MRPRSTVRAVLAAATSAAAGLALAVTGATVAHAATPLPTHVFAPYFEAWNGDSPTTLSQQSGAKYLTFAFIQTASAGSCTAYWNGSTSQPISSATFGGDISTLQANGGDAIASFGGYSADTTGTDIADSCTSASSIAAVYEKVITTYNISRIDLDVEQDSLTNTAGISRRNQAIAKVESWAASNGRSVQFSYTLPSTTTGMDSADTAVIDNAISNGAKISVVNLMTFDYYTGTSHEMATATETAASGLESQLASLYPSLSSAQLWNMVGITEMPGIDDYGTGETFTQADATTVLQWAQSKGVNTLSFWALQRDNGGCPGTAGSDSCSGISQPTWYFSNTFEKFTGTSGGGGGGTGGGGSTIVGNASGLCLGVTGNTLKSTADINTCDGDSGQQWTVNADGSIANGSGLCLSVTGSSTTPKATADIYTCNGSASEQWSVNSDGTIHNTNSGLCLSVTGGSTSPGATADIYTCNGSASEYWTTK